MTIGFALCGSYCTYDRVFPVIEALSKESKVIPILSEAAYATDSRSDGAQPGRPGQRLQDTPTYRSVLHGNTDSVL